MNEAADEVIGLIYGHWRSQILYAGVELGVFDHVGRNCSKPVEAVAAGIGADEKLLYRLMRALASLGLLVEDESRGFAASEAGELLRSDHPQSLRHRVLVTDGPEHYAIWKHLPDIIRDGKQDGFIREFGARAFEYAQTNSRYRRTFDQGMTGYSVAQSDLVLEALRDYDFSKIRTVCDIGGGRGHLICALLKAQPHLSGLVVDLPEVFEDPSPLWASRLKLEDRCRYVAGDMFKQAPPADAYTLKMILHDWDDQACIRILSNLSGAGSPEGRVFVIEHIVPGPREAHFAKLFDIHMMCWGTGRERTEAEYARILEAAGWKYYRTWYPNDRTIGVVEGRFST
jgi:O-methyltransferase domain/Dimerisation domain